VIDTRLGHYARLTADMTEGLAVVVLANGPADLEGAARSVLEIMRGASRESNLPSEPQRRAVVHLERASDYSFILRPGSLPSPILSTGN
jgi:hypothetical protein